MKNNHLHHQFPLIEIKNEPEEIMANNDNNFTASSIDIAYESKDDLLLHNTDFQPFSYNNDTYQSQALETQNIEVYEDDQPAQVTRPNYLSETASLQNRVDGLSFEIQNLKNQMNTILIQLGDATLKLTHDVEQLQRLVANSIETVAPIQLNANDKRKSNESPSTTSSIAKKFRYNEMTNRYDFNGESSLIIEPYENENISERGDEANTSSGENDFDSSNQNESFDLNLQSNHIRINRTFRISANNLIDRTIWNRLNTSEKYTRIKLTEIDNLAKNECRKISSYVINLVECNFNRNTFLSGITVTRFGYFLYLKCRQHYFGCKASWNIRVDILDNQINAVCNSLCDHISN